MVSGFDLTLPKNQRPIAGLYPHLGFFLIPLDISSDLIIPEIRICGGRPKSLLAVMCVPETAVNLDDFLLAGKHDVRFAGKFRVVNPEPVSGLVQE